MMVVTMMAVMSPVIANLLVNRRAVFPPLKVVRLFLAAPGKRRVKM
jgi:hypothetical protein